MPEKTISRANMIPANTLIFFILLPPEKIEADMWSQITSGYDHYYDSL